MNDELTLSILDGGSKSRAIVLASCRGDIAITQCPCGKPLKKLTATRERISDAIEGVHKPLTNDELAAFGAELYEYLLNSQDLRDIFGRLPNAHIRIQIMANRPELQALPWEYLQRPGGPGFGPDNDRSIVRVIPTVGIKAPEPKKLDKGAKLRILFAAADPVDEEPVSWVDSKRRIEKIFGMMIGENFELVPVEAANRESLLDALQGQDFDIFHFSGHGSVGRDDIGQLVLVDSEGKKRMPVTGPDLGGILKGRGIRLAVLSACQTSAGDFSKPFAVVSEALVKMGIPAVVANQLPIPDQSMAAFSAAIYRELLISGDIDKAMTEGRIRLKADLELSPRGGLEWGIPTLHRHINASQLFEPLKP